MSVTEHQYAGPTRRGFLKAAGAAVGTITLGAAGTMATTDEWFVSTTAEAAPEEHIGFTFHQKHCGGQCPLQCTVRDGRLALIQPNKSNGDRYATICLKGISEIEHIYNETRIQTPLKRVGERGSGEYVPISWDEALDTMVSELTRIQEEYGEGSILYKGNSETDMRFIGPLFKAQDGGFGGIDMGIGNGMDPAIGFGGGYAYAANEARDWVNTDLLILCGTNWLESTLAQPRQFFEAKDAGARTICIDPHFSTTASKCDQWIPIRPGTDAALFLAMITEVLENDWVDHDFCKQHTSFPFLVDPKTGLMLRDEISDEKPEVGSGTDNPFYVWDESTNVAVRYDSAGAEPALEGTFTVNGTEYTTVFSFLKESQKEYTTEWAAGITEIPADIITELAANYGTADPACLALGWGGGDKISNADIAGHAAVILTALTGNMVKPGSGVGVYVGGVWNGYAASFGAWELPEQYAMIPSEIASYNMRYEDSGVRALISNGDNFQQKYANYNKSIEWAKSLDFIVHMDVYYSEPASWADLILPICSRFELEEDFGFLSSGYNHVVMQGKVIDPLFEAKPELWIEQQVAKRLGAEKHLPKSYRELAEHQLRTSPDPYLRKVTVDDIIQNGYMYPLEGIEEPRHAFQDYAFNTPSGRMDVYYNDLVEFDQALPTYEDPLEVGAGNPLRDTYPLQFSNIRTKFRIHNQFAGARWIQQYYEPYVELNPSDMESRGLAMDDVVEVFNDRGSFKCAVKSNPAVRPGSARMYEGATEDYLVEGTLQSVTNDDLIERGNALMQGPVIPYSDTLVEVKKA